MKEDLKKLADNVVESLSNIAKKLLGKAIDEKIPNEETEKPEGE